MFRRNRFNVSNKNLSQCDLRKCAYHRGSYSYIANMRVHDNVAARIAGSANMQSTVTVKVLFHFLAPHNTYNTDNVLNRAHDIILSLNEDFNNYSTNPNTMNNFKYKNIVNQVFLTNMEKQRTYLGGACLPVQPSNITFELGQVYYYPIASKLNLSSYDDTQEVEMEQQAVKQYINQNRAAAIMPENFLNIWVIDMTDTSILGFSSFPWETVDDYNGVVVSRRVFFPEDYAETNFGNYKTITHSVGHYFGLSHIYGQSGEQNCVGGNINDDDNTTTETFDVSNPTSATYDPLDKVLNRRLHCDDNYNPLFMNFMDNTYDKYVTMFTHDQLQQMRNMIQTYRPKLNNRINPPAAKYDPNADSLSSISLPRTSTTIPSMESSNRLRGQNTSTETGTQTITESESTTTTIEKPMEHLKISQNLYEDPRDPNQAYLHYHQYYQQVEDEQRLTTPDTQTVETNNQYSEDPYLGYDGPRLYDPRYVNPNPMSNMAPPYQYQQRQDPMSNMVQYQQRQEPMASHYQHQQRQELIPKEQEPDIESSEAYIESFNDQPKINKNINSLLNKNNPPKNNTKQLEQRLNDVKEQLKNIKTNINKSPASIMQKSPTMSEESLSTKDLIIQSTPTESKPKYNKYGQQEKTLPKPRSTISTRPPQKRFTRTRPSN